MGVTVYVDALHCQRRRKEFRSVCVGGGGGGGIRPVRRILERGAGGGPLCDRAGGEGPPCKTLIYKNLGK